MTMTKETFNRGIQLFGIFSSAMLFAFTGGMVVMPIVEKEIVEKRHWMTEKEFWSYPAIAQSMPGVVGIHNGIMIGNHVAGPFGSVMAVLGVIFTAFTSMLLLGIVFQNICHNPFVFGAVRGIRVISIVVIFGVSINLVRTVPRGAFTQTIVIFSILLPIFFGLSAFQVILLSGISGIIYTFLNPNEEETGK